MDQIEKVDVDVDEDGIHLRLEGDFTDSFTDYLTSSDQDGITLRLPNNDAEALSKMLLNAISVPWQ